MTKLFSREMINKMILPPQQIEDFKNRADVIPFEYCENLGKVEGFISQDHHILITKIKIKPEELL